MLAPWAELGAPVVPPAPSGGKSWRSAPAGRSDSTREGVLEPTVWQEELPAVEPEVLAELVEQHEPEVLEASGPGLPAYCCCCGGWKRGRVLLPEATGVIFLFLSSISWCLRSVLSALSIR